MSPTLTAILVISFVFLMTCLGSAVIFLFKKEIDKKYSIFFNTFAGGIMLASSFFSLLSPSVTSSQNYGDFAFVPVCVGTILGALFMYGLDYYLNKTRKGKEFKGQRLTKKSENFYCNKPAQHSRRVKCRSSPWFIFLCWKFNFICNSYFSCYRDCNTKLARRFCCVASYV